MTPHLFVIAADDLEHDEVTLTGAEGRHAVTVRRIRLGENVLLTDGDGAVGLGRVSKISGKDKMTVRLFKRWIEPEPVPHVTVVQALVKGGRLERAVEALTEVGVDTIIPWSASNCIVSWKGDSAKKSVNKLRRGAREASKQARRAREPEVAALASTSQVLRVIGESDCVVVLHEDADQALSDISLDDAATIAIIVGPEGGISDFELKALCDAGGVAARMGPTVLRGGTAGVVALGWILGTSGRWSKLTGPT